MQVVARYEYEEGRFAWPVPFSYQKISDIGVKLALPSGQERRLRAGVDYVIAHGQVVYVLGEHCSLIIYLDRAESNGGEGSAPDQISLETNSEWLASAMGTSLTNACAQHCPQHPASDIAQPAAQPAAQLQVYASQQPAAAIQPQVISQQPAQPVAQPMQAAYNLAAAPMAIQPLADAGVVNDSQVQPASDARLIELENKLEKLIAEQASQREQALMAAREAASDSQIQNLEAAGQKKLSLIETQTELAIEDIGVAVDEAERSIKAKANSLEEVSRLAEDSANAASAAADAANEAAGKALSQSEEALKALEAKVAELEERLADSARAATNSVSLAALDATNQVRNASAAAQAEASQASRLAGQDWSQQSWFTLTQDMPARSLLYLPEPLAYYPGRNSLRIARNGYMLAQGRDFEEVGNALEISTVIRILGAASSGDVWNFWIAPTNQTQAASISASQAKDYAVKAQGAAVKAEAARKETQTLADNTITKGTALLNNINTQGAQAVRNVAIARDNSLDEIRSLTKTSRQEAALYWQACGADIRKEAEASSRSARALWQDAHNDLNNVRKEAQAKAEACAAAAERSRLAGGKSASQAHALAECAWAAAYQASLFRASPGIGTVRNLEQLDNLPSGLYIINPEVPAPLPFLGVYPADNAEDINADGFFLVGAIPWPELPEPPDIPYPENPEDIPEMQPAAAIGHWLPCDHHHGD